MTMELRFERWVAALSDKNRERSIPDDRLATPQESRRRVSSKSSPDRFGRATESIARFMGTPQFILWMTIFCALWLGWNTLAPEDWQFDPRSLNFTLLTLALSLQASYAAPLLLLAQNRQDDRDRVVASQDRQRDQQNLEETQYLTREIASLRIALREVATRDYVRGELRDIMDKLEEIEQNQARLSQTAQEIKDPLTGAITIVAEEQPAKKKRKVKDLEQSANELDEN